MSACVLFSLTCRHFWFACLNEWMWKSFHPLSRDNAAVIWRTEFCRVYGYTSRLFIMSLHFSSLHSFFQFWLFSTSLCKSAFIPPFLPILPLSLSILISLLPVISSLQFLYLNFISPSSRSLSLSLYCLFTKQYSKTNHPSIDANAVIKIRANYSFSLDFLLILSFCMCSLFYLLSGALIWSQENTSCKREFLIDLETKSTEFTFHQQKHWLFGWL